MVKMKLNGISIDLPYEPYESQKQTMEKILTCMSEGSSGMIESPTGTGKSLSIICAVLAYKEHLRRNYVAPTVPPKKAQPDDTKIGDDTNKEDGTKISDEVKSSDDFKIIICRKTHKQLDQLVQQPNKTRYRPRITILASRTQYCVHPK